MAALQLVSSFVLQNSVTGPEKKLEKAIDLAYYTHARAIVQSRPSDYVVSTFKQQLTSCRLQLAPDNTYAVSQQLARS